MPQRESQRAALGGDVASHALNEALRVSFRLLKFAMVLVAALFFLSGIFTVKQGEQAFVLRFGKIVTSRDATGEERAVLGPGIHFAWPFLIDEIVRFPVEERRELPMEAFWYQEEKQQPGRRLPAGLTPGQGGYALTGDVNILHSSWHIVYQIADPVRFFTKLNDPDALAPSEAADTYEGLLTSLLRNAVIRMMARSKVDDAYRRGQGLLRAEIREALKAEVDQLHIGIKVLDVTVDPKRPITPPRQVKEAFDAAQQAEQESSALIGAARGDASKIVNDAKGAASRVLTDAERYKSTLINQAAGDAKYIGDLLTAYPGQPHLLGLFLQQRLIEVVEEALAASDERFVVTEDDTTGRREVRILLNREPKAVIEKIKREQEKAKKKKEEK